MLVLIVDENVKIRRAIQEELQRKDYQSVEATNLQSTWELFLKYEIDLVVLDRDMTGQDALAFCKRIKEKRAVPVVFLSEKEKEEDRLEAFEAGADDYLLKPFFVRELVARINAILKRNLPPQIRFKGILIDTKARMIYVDGQEVYANRKEYELLKLFMTNVGVLLSREELIKNVWGYELSKVDRTIDTHIKMLRTKMGPYQTYLVTIRGVGYKLSEV